MKIKALALMLVGAAATAGALFLLPANHATAQGPDTDATQTWDAFGGNQQAQKYSTATQITPDNVGNLKKA
jgi:glucose dehydrogenase